MELRSFLIRRMKIAKTRIETEINMLNSLLNILVPNDITILLANRIQTETALTPIDSIQVAIAHENMPAVLISRDKELLRIPKNYIKVSTPEGLLTTLK